MSTAKAKAAAKKKKKNTARRAWSFEVHEPPFRNDGEVTWNNSIKTCCVKSFSTEIHDRYAGVLRVQILERSGKPIARKLNPIKRRLKKQLIKVNTAIGGDDYGGRRGRGGRRGSRINSSSVRRRKSRRRNWKTRFS